MRVKINCLNRYAIYADGEVLYNNVIYDTSITDCDDAYVKGKICTYTLLSTCDNIPTTDNSWYITSICNVKKQSANDYVTQIATNSANSSTNEIYIRHRYLSSSTSNPVWTDWVRMVGNKTYFSGSIGSFSSGNTVTTLKTITLPAGKTISGTMTCNLGGTTSNIIALLMARTTPPTTVDSSEITAGHANTPNPYNMVTCPFCITNGGTSSITIYLCYYQATATYTATVRATYTIF